MPQPVTRQQRRAAERQAAKAAKRNGSAPSDKPVPPLQGPTESGPIQNVPDGVWIQTQEQRTENGGVRLDIGIACTGNTKATEILTILRMALKKHEQDNALN